jgi:hypothetical protein
MTHDFQNGQDEKEMMKKLQVADTWLTEVKALPDSGRINGFFDYNTFYVAKDESELNFLE